MLKVITNLAFASSRKRIIKCFEEGGSSSHSSRADTLGVLINHCEENKIPYQLTARPGMGYYLTKIKEVEQICKEIKEQEDKLK